MPRHCATTWGDAGCRANYTDSEVVTTYKLPKDEFERELWIKALPNEFKSSSKNAAICARHWPSGFPTVMVKGRARPRDPPSLFGVPNSVLPQTPAKQSRNADSRNCTASARLANAEKSAAAKQVKNDSFLLWSDFVKYCESLDNDFLIMKSSDSVTIIKMEGFPPEVKFSVQIGENFKFRAYRGSKPDYEKVTTYCHS